MTESRLFWHCATYSEGGDDWLPAHQHQLIAAAGIEVTGEDDESGLGLEANVWAIMSPEPRKTLMRSLRAIYERLNFVTCFGYNFGLPVLNATALRCSLPTGFDETNSVPNHLDVVREISSLVSPDRPLTFNEVLDLLELPLRPDLDVLQLWESGDSDKQQRIPKRLIIDCCFVALMDLRLRLVRGEINQQYADNYARMILEAAAQKVKMVKKVFRSYFEEPEEGEPADKPKPQEEPVEDLEPEEVEASGQDDALDDFDDFEEGGEGEESKEEDFDTEEESEDSDLSDFDDFGDLDDDDF